MNSNKSQIMTCGACSVIMDEDGQMTTSIDTLVGGAKRLVSKFTRRSNTSHAEAVARI